MSTSTTMTSTGTTTAAATATTACINVYQLPTTDAACAAPLNGNMSSVFDTCCKGSPVKYDNDCGIYCLAQDQTVDKLSHCLQEQSNNYAAVFCNDALNATATAAMTTHSSTATKTGSSAESTTTKNGAGKTSVVGVGVLVMVFCSVVGAFV